MVVLHVNFNQSSLSLKTLRDFSIDIVVLYLNFNQFVFEDFKRFFN
jgi:hypothetical protein